MAVPNEILQIKKAVEAELLQRPGVTGVDVGYKYVNGQKTDQIAIRVLVEEKKDVPPEQRIPNTIQGVKTDVIERKIVLHPRRVRAADLETKADTLNYDPLKGGIGIGPCREVDGFIYVGTLGAIVKDNATGNPMMLSNFHVMCVNNSWSVGDTIAQPSRVDGGNCPTDIVGTLQRASLGGQVDCAVANITARGNACEIVDIGEVTGTATATLGMAVRKRGRTTGLGYGTVDSIDLTVSVDYDGIGTVTFTNQIGIQVNPAQSTQFGNSGDSGSVVVNDERKVVGLYFAGTEDGAFGVANPIQAVLDTLNVSICVPTPPKSVIKDIKDGKSEFKELKNEKFEKIEFKERKNEKFEIKERKFEKIEKPEFERLPKDFSEIPDPKFSEGDPFTPPQIPNLPGFGGSMEQRLANLEAAFGQLMHFISPELRPNLGMGALNREPDVSGANLSALSQHLQKQAADAKQAKDSKDVEKLSELR